VNHLVQYNMYLDSCRYEIFPFYIHGICEYTTSLQLKAYRYIVVVVVVIVVFSVSIYGPVNPAAESFALTGSIIYYIGGSCTYEIGRYYKSAAAIRFGGLIKKSLEDYARDSGGVFVFTCRT